jgi:hypothetical protein
MSAKIIMQTATINNNIIPISTTWRFQITPNRDNRDLRKIETSFFTVFAICGNYDTDVIIIRWEDRVPAGF